MRGKDSHDIQNIFSGSLPKFNQLFSDLPEPTCSPKFVKITNNSLSDSYHKQTNGVKTLSPPAVAKVIKCNENASEQQRE